MVQRNEGAKVIAACSRLFIAAASTLRNARRRRRFMDSSTKQKRRGSPFANLALDLLQAGAGRDFLDKKLGNLERCESQRRSPDMNHDITPHSDF